jgi:hypothetical protein
MRQWGNEAMGQWDGTAGVPASERVGESAGAKPLGAER